MKSKFAFMACTVLCFLSVPVFADDFIYFGGNYSNTIADGNMSHALGGNFSAIGDYGGAKKIYSAIGFTVEITDRKDLLTADLKALGVDDMNTRFYSVPLRVGYPFFFDINDDMRFMLIPSLAFDLHFFHADFTQKLYGYKVNYELSGWGYSLGVSVNAGMQHKFNKIYLRYGVDFDLPFMTLLIADINYSGYVKGSTSDSVVNTMADYFLLFCCLRCLFLLAVPVYGRALSDLKTFNFVGLNYEK